MCTLTSFSFSLCAFLCCFPNIFSHVLSLCSVRVVCLYCALKITIMNTPHIFRLVCIPFLGASLFFCCHFCFNIDLLEFFVMKNVFRSFVFAIGLCAKSVFLLHKWIKMKLKRIYESRIAVVWDELITAHFGIAMNLDFFSRIERMRVSFTKMNIFIFPLQELDSFHFPMPFFANTLSFHRNVIIFWLDFILNSSKFDVSFKCSIKIPLTMSKTYKRFYF